MARHRVPSHSPLLRVPGPPPPGSPSARAGRQGQGRSAGAAGRGRRGHASGADGTVEDSGSEREAEVALGSRAPGLPPRARWGRRREGRRGRGWRRRRGAAPSSQRPKLGAGNLCPPAPRAFGDPRLRHLAPGPLRPCLESRRAPPPAALGYKGGRMSRAAAVRRGATPAAATAAAPGSTQHAPARPAAAQA